MKSKNYIIDRVEDVLENIVEIADSLDNLYEGNAHNPLHPKDVQKTMKHLASRVQGIRDMLMVAHIENGGDEDGK